MCLVLTCFLIFTFFNTLSAQSPPPIELFFDHSDPAGDVHKYNATLNGTIVDDPEFIVLDIKWVHCEKDGSGNIVLTMDLKSKLKFLHEDETKYVFRILTSLDNSTGYNITYKNNTALMVPFSPKGNGTPINIISHVSFNHDKGDEMMVITISITQYLSNITHFGVDAYSMKVLDNATYLDYISELPGHPEYVNPAVEEGENIDGGGSEGTSSSEEEAVPAIIWIGILIVIIVLVLIIILVWIAKKRQRY